MKVLITEMQSEGKKVLVGYQVLSNETENIKHSLIEVEAVTEKEGYKSVIYFDEEANTYKFVLEELEKTQEEVLEEEVTKLKKALANVMAKNLKPSEEPTIPPEAEMAGLSEEDLLELNSIDPTSI